jgi:murein DD-endopeptidase MepM/ murein hydrolase activator NlpD
MNMGGKGGKSTRIIVDLNDAVKQLNISLEKTKKLSAEILTNMKGIKGGGGAANPMSPDTFSTTPVTAATGATGSKAIATFMDQGTVAVGDRSPSGFIQQAARKESGGGGSNNGGGGNTFGSALWGAAKTLLGAGAMATLQAIQPEQYIENDMSARRAGFYMGTGGNAGFVAGGKLFQSMMNGGTATDPLDAARAVMMGASSGMMPGAPGYNNVSAGAQMFSNLMPGAGLEGGMQATVALNQAQSVNKLRMLGIQVRGSNGTMNSPQQIADQVWEYLNKIKGPGGAIKTSDIEFSLQPGNSLDGMLNQYFGNDPVLRQGVVAALLQKASGGTLSKSSLVATGASSAVAQSYSNLYSAQYNAVNAYTQSGVSGVIDANNGLTAAANLFAAHVKEFGGLVHDLAFLKTFSAGFNNSIGTLLSGLGSVVGSALSGLFKGVASASAASAETSAALDAGTAAESVAATTAVASVAAPAAVLAGGAAVLYAGSMWVGSETQKAFTAAGINYKAWLKDYSSSPRAALGLRNPETLAKWKKEYPLSSGSNGMGSGAGPGTPVGVGDSSQPMSSVYDPLQGKLIINKNGEFHNAAAFRHGGWHRGVDFRAADGTTVYAVKPGKVKKAGVEGDLGNMVRIDHGDGSLTVYGHLTNQLVGDGQTVNAGDPIGISGHSGGVYPAGPAGAHLHLALEDPKGNVYDPMTLFGGGGQAPTATASSATSATHQLFKTQGASLFGSGASAFSNVPTTPAGGGAGNSSVVASSSGANYGNVTVNINLPTGSVVNEQKLAREVKRILDEQDHINMAVTR